MATRCNIIVKDKESKIQLYRHWDGYPEAVVPELEQALQFAWPLPRFDARDFSAAIVRAWKQEGGNIYIDGKYTGYDGLPAILNICTLYIWTIIT